MVSSLLTPLISLLDMKFQTIEVSLMHNLYATISHFKVSHVEYYVLPVDINSIIQMIHYHQLISSLKINCF